MILFFYGEETYRLKQKLNKLKEKFVSSSLGDTNLAILDGKTTPYNDINRQILAMPFLAKNRLVIIEDLLKEGNKENQEKVIDLLKKVPESTVLVFAEYGKVDKRSSLYKKLNKPGQAQEFKLLEEDALKRWIRAEVANRGGEIAPDAVVKLVEYVGSDLWRMSNEIAKLITYDRQITTDNIELLVQTQIQSNIFGLIDAVAAKAKKRAIKELYKLFGSGQAELYVLTMIIYQYRNLLIVKDAEIRWPYINKWALAKKIQLHPFVLDKTKALTPKYGLDDLKKIYGKLLSYESAVKIGKIKPRIALELLVFELTR